MKTVYAADLFCGAGGSSSGLYRAAKKLGVKVNLLAVNHWPMAIETHSANHTVANHICETLDSVDPRKVVPRGKLDLLVASPECTHHSIARGGRPMQDQSRASAWHVLRWAEALDIRNIIVENVKEFQSWGPLGTNGLPLKRRKGETFKAFIKALESLGYKVEFRVLNSADYGDPTTRKRLFIMAKKGSKLVRWPEQTHSKDGADLFGRKKWRAAREIIDWDLEAQSIFNRKRPLAEKTLRRIAAGLVKFGGEPFFAMLYGTNKARDINRPAPTVTAGGMKIGLVEPFVLQQQSGGAPRSTKDPLPTVATKGAISLIEPFFVAHNGERKGQEPRVHSVNDPAPTVTSRGLDLIEPYLVCVNHGEDKKSKNPSSRAKSINEPLPTISTHNGWALLEPYIMEYLGKDSKKTKGKRKKAKAKKGMKYMLDIKFRMLQPHELARAMSFKDDYVFKGNKSEKVKQIGNAVAVSTAEALCLAALT
jgi:DNA (cytosine-5)-methyltransferase 1